jgi:hypothetical protein
VHQIVICRHEILLQKKENGEGSMVTVVTIQMSLPFSSAAHAG